MKNQTAMMEHSSYSAKVKALENRLNRLQAHNPFSKDRMGYLYASANLYHLLPGREAEHPDFYRDVLYNEQLAIIERNLLPEIRDRIRIKGSLDFAEQKGRCGKILCSFHTGSFYAVLDLFARYDMDVTVGISPNAYQRVKTDIDRDVKRLAKKGNSQLQVELLDMGIPMAVFRLARKLRAGKHVMLFVDAGFQGKDPEEAGKTMRLPFLKGELKVKKGAAILAYLTGASLLPVICHRVSGEELLLEIHTEIVPGTDISAQEFGDDSMRTLFRILENSVGNTPEQWEGWLYAHALVEPRTLPPKPERLVSQMREVRDLVLNEARYGILSDRKNHFLFDRQHYRKLQISPELFNVLRNTDKVCDWFTADQGTFDYLYSNQILISRSL